MFENLKMRNYLVIHGYEKNHSYFLGFKNFEYSDKLVVALAFIEANLPYLKKEMAQIGWTERYKVHLNNFKAILEKSHREVK